MKVIQRNKLQTLSDELHPHSIEKHHVTLLFLQFTTTTPKICYRESDLLLGRTRGRMGRVICNLYVCVYIDGDFTFSHSSSRNSSYPSPYILFYLLPMMLVTLLLHFLSR